MLEENINKLFPKQIAEFAGELKEDSKKNTLVMESVDKNSIESPQFFKSSLREGISPTFYSIDGSNKVKTYHNYINIGIYAAGYLGYQKKGNIFENVIPFKKEEQLVSIKKGRYGSPIKDLCSIGLIQNLFKLMEGSYSQIVDMTDNIKFDNFISVCRGLLEWAYIYEILTSDSIKKGDYILRDGSLRTPEIRHKYLIKLGEEATKKGITLVAYTKETGVKTELIPFLKELDEKRPEDHYCFFEIPEKVLSSVYESVNAATKGIDGKRGFGIYYVARLSLFVLRTELDWNIIDLNYYDLFNEIDEDRIQKVKYLMSILSFVCQENSLPGYAFIIQRAHNKIVITEKKFKRKIREIRDGLIKNGVSPSYVEYLFSDIHNYL